MDHFDYEVVKDEADRITELTPKLHGAHLLLHPAARGQTQGQSQVKLVFDVPDVHGARERFVQQGVAIGPIHHADGYDFCNLKDPSGNSVSLSRRAFRPHIV
ncbi:VOC family protein [Sinorhizobium garamanticum]|uniref:VOC family protein n=1 Tax=Sinorhizobium garamanticum TaxID=680247 RepID=A0ABY8DJ68_9HYPH|nr:VOC family protein [Sinorhizobium garamanticum]WEX90965.1 VOC family protein [Sinorhizobium garamanticum]